MEDSSSFLDQGEVEFIKCESCGFTEECTSAYISRIRERYCGMWLCGLCIEAVKDEALRSERRISTKEALNRHISVCKNFQSSTSPPPSTSSNHPILAMGKIIRKSLDSPRSGRSSPNSSPLRELNQSPPAMIRSSGSCYSNSTF
ncbi:OLC1v1037907C1 [Oldenlandia corymbosa var. corymbosa]|uniref:OLC1v1037907C1 n=1 Tax=Oldenlandia corymbosa var. corymbosa TaxID=529605 RepID=A0AAV1CZS3_OLDCO|nr:OLC1v1037907C1 [Oldenlandia corymbosa var. corymbosa]